MSYSCVRELRERKSENQKLLVRSQKSTRFFPFEIFGLRQFLCSLFVFVFVTVTALASSGEAKVEATEIRIERMAK